jgi:hypothetical protein
VAEAITTLYLCSYVELRFVDWQGHRRKSHRVSESGLLVEIIRFLMFLCICIGSVVLMRPMPKTGTLLLCVGALILPLSRAMKDGGMMSVNEGEGIRKLILSEGFLFAAIFLSAASFLSAFSPDCTLAVFFWIVGIVLLVAFGNELTWKQSCGFRYPRLNSKSPEKSTSPSNLLHRSLADKRFRRRLLAYSAALLVSVFLNFYALSSIPYNIHGDEGEIAERALLVPLFKEFFRPQALWWHLPTPDLLLQRIGFLAGEGLWAVRAGSAFYGVVANLLILGVLRRLVSSWLAAGCWMLIITAPNLLQSYRQGLDIAVPVILSALFVGLVLRLFSTSVPRSRTMVLIGTVLGTSMVVYVSARGLFVAWGVIGSLLLISCPSILIAWRFLKEMIVSLVVAVLVMGPMVSYHFKNPQVPVVREQYSSEFQEDFVHSNKTQDWFAMVDTRVAGSISTIFSQRERIGGDFYSYFAGLLPISVVVLTFLSIASPSPRFRACVVLLLVGVVALVVVVSVPLRNYDRFHRVSLVFPFFAVTAVIGLHTILERVQRAYLPVASVMIFTLCLLVSAVQAVTYVRTHDDSYEWEFLSPKTRAARTLQLVLKEFPADRIYCIADPWFSCINGTFRLLIPGIAERAVNFTRESFLAANIPLDSGEVVLLSAGFEPLKEPGFGDRLPPRTEKREWQPQAFRMAGPSAQDESLEALFSEWRVPPVMPNRAPDITVTLLSLP